MRKKLLYLESGCRIIFFLDIYVVIIVSLHLGFPTDQILFSSDSQFMINKILKKNSSFTFSHHRFTLRLLGNLWTLSLWQFMLLCSWTLSASRQLFSNLRKIQFLSDFGGPILTQTTKTSNLFCLSKAKIEGKTFVYVMSWPMFFMLPENFILFSRIQCRKER